MVQGIPELKRRLGKVAARLEKELRPELAAAAARIVVQMRSLKPLAAIQVEWTWGPPPAGVLELGTVSAAPGDRVFISIYANAFTSEYPGGKGFPAVARWFEFGTLNRYQDTGKFVGSITAQPYFFPVYRANKKAVRSAIARQINKTVKNL
jgi:hypothetical protein